MQLDDAVFEILESVPEEESTVGMIEDIHDAVDSAYEKWIEAGDNTNG